MAEPGTAIVGGRGARRARRGHPWIFAEDLLGADAAPGDVVRVLDRDGHFCCHAAFSPRSRIVLRRVSRGAAPCDDAYWQAALGGALARRGTLAPDGCGRLIHADAEGFPGLTVDRYGAHLVLQATTAWADRAAPGLAAWLAERVAAVSILARNDASGRALEGLPRGVTQIAGTTPQEIDVVEGGTRRPVAPWTGHKTGLYLDQQDNHAAAAGWLGAGRVLDLFAAEGGFAVPLAAAGADVLAVEQSEPLIGRGRRAAENAGAGARVRWERANAFDVLAALEREGARFDAVVLDPPPFARRRGESEGALKGYRDLHRRGLRLLAPKGRLLTFSCSFATGAAEFEQAVREGAEEAAIDVEVLGRPGPAADHPECLDLPESRYLKGLLLARRPN